MATEDTPAGPVVHQIPQLGETLADELIGAAYMEGNIMLTFAINRLFEGIGEQQAPAYKTVVCRLALTRTAFAQLTAAIPRLEGTIRLAEQKPATGDKPN